MTPTLIRVLILEDNRDDADLMIAGLKHAGFQPRWTRVEKEADYLSQLQNEYDIILSDYSMPQFNAPRALRILLEQELDIPFIIVSGSITEESAIECMKLGATDYLLKDRPARLGPAISNALREKALRDERQRVLDALAESEARFRRLVENVPDVIYRYNVFPRPSYEYVSPSIESILGYSPEEFYNDPEFVFKIMHPEDVHMLRRTSNEITPRHSSKIMRWIHADGSIVWIEDYTVPILDEKGELVAVEGVARNITERYLVEEELRLANRSLQTILRCNQILTKAADETELLDKICHVLVEAGGYRLAWVAYAENDQQKSVRVIARAGYDEGYLDSLDLTWADSEGGYGSMGTAVRTGKTSISQDIATDPNFVAMRSRALERGYRSSIGLPLISGDQLIGAVAVYATHANAFDPIEIELLSNLANDIAYGIVAIRAREESKRAQEAMMEANVLRVQLEKEKELSELKSRFITIASHEFRTPLSTILTSSDLLRLYGPRLSEQRKDEHLGHIQTAVRHMTGLMDDVLTIGKIESERMKFMPVSMNLEIYCANLIEELRLTLTTSHEINFSTRGDCSEAVMDEKLLRQILTNLITNGIKYSPDGGSVTVDVACDAGWAEIYVHDDGIGIPEADKFRLFETFHRGRNVGTIPGTGLGLAITKASVELHGGEIQFLTEEGVGTTFIVRLPLMPPENDSSG